MRKVNCPLRYTSVLVLCLAMTSESPAAVRVAMMNFISEDNSHRSTLAAMDFTAALQAMLGGEVSWEWVERSDLVRVEEEFKLSGLGLVDRAESLRSGRWVRADWAVFGRISTNAPGGRQLDMEIVDLGHADVLAATNLTLPAQTGTHFRLNPAELSPAAAALRACLAHADRVYQQTRRPPAVALLFLSRTGTGKDFENGEGELRAALVAASSAAEFHLIQLLRPGASMDEANLVLTGLAQSDPDAWEKVADYYVWGKCAARERRNFDRETRQWRTDTTLDYLLEVWDGRGAPQTVSLALTNVASDVAAARAAAAVAPLLTPRATAPVTDGVRRTIAESLTTHVVELARSTPALSHSSPQGMERWLAVVQVLETACFFDPGNATARELWARVRWSRRAEQASPNQFFFARRRSEAWGRHVEQFGFTSVWPAPPSASWWDTDSVAFEYVLSAWPPFDLFSFSQYDQARAGVPRDAGGPELLAWRRQFAEVFYSRLLAAPDDAQVAARARNHFYRALAFSGNELVIRNPAERRRILEKLWPLVLEAQHASPARFDDAYLRGLRRHFEEIGQPGGERVWLAQLEEIAQAQASRDRAQPVSLPRAATLETQNPSKSP